MLNFFNNYNIVVMERSLTSQDPKQYAYLSIDQLRQTFNPRRTLDKTSMNQFFNIKFDNQSPLKEKIDQKGFAKLIHPNSHKKSQQSSQMFDRFKNSQERRLYFSSNPRTKKLNTEKMLESITKILEKQQSTKKSSKDFSIHKKPIKLFSSDIGSQNSSLDKSHLSASPPNESNQRNAHQDKNRRLLFQQMLKKCQKLKQIYKYQNQLINMRHFKDSNLGVRFHTEPIGSLSAGNSIHQPFSFPKKINQKKMIKYMCSNNENRQYIDGQNKKSLDIRKYKNESVLKQRLKYFIKKSQTKKQQSDSRALRRDRHSEKRRYIRGHRDPIEERAVVGPWADEDEVFDIEFR